MYTHIHVCMRESVWAISLQTQPCVWPNLNTRFICIHAYVFMYAHVHVYMREREWALKSADTALCLARFKHKACIYTYICIHVYACVSVYAIVCIHVGTY